MPLVEVIPHQQTDAETIATVVAFAKRQGKTAIVVGMMQALCESYFSALFV